MNGIKVSALGVSSDTRDPRTVPPLLMEPLFAYYSHTIPTRNLNSEKLLGMGDPIVGGPCLLTSIEVEFGIRNSYEFQHTYEPLHV